MQTSYDNPENQHLGNNRSSVISTGGCEEDEEFDKKLERK